MRSPPPIPLRFLLFLLAALLCLASTGSQAQSFQARNVTLLSHLDLYDEYSNSWPYIHPDGREYVAVGTRFGTSIVRLTNPANPVEVGFIPGLNCGTRDADQYQTYIYVVAGLTRAGDPGIQIISMADPDHPVLVNTIHGSVETAENITIDPARALMFTSETNQQNFPSGLHILSLADPANPVQLAAYDLYEVHDFTAFGNIGFASDISSGILHVLDITNPSAPAEIATVSTGEAVHSFAPTADGQFLYVTDENFGAPEGGLVSIFDIQNLSQVLLVSKLNLVPFATAHYVRIRGALAFFAYYTGGVRVWDVSNPSWPAEAGYLDTWSGDDLTLDGTYDMSPYYPSGIATATDRELGLFVFRAESNYGIVRGTVSVGKMPLAGVTVRTLPEGVSTTTDASGRFALAPAPGSALTIEASKFGYGSSTTTVSVAQGSDQTLTFTLSKLGTGTVKGTVVRASDQALLEAVEVTGVGTPLRASTSSRGVYSLTAVPEGPILVRAERPGFVPKTISTPVAAKATSTLDFALQSAAFYDDVELDRGWTMGVPDDDAVEGRWIRAVPVGTKDENGVQAQPGKDNTPAPGSMCFVTGNGVMNGDPFASDVDGGKTTLMSPPLSLGSVVDPRIVYWRWFYTNNITAGPRGNPFVTDISNDNGATWTRVDSIRGQHNSWQRVEIRVRDYFPFHATVRVRFIARDVGLGPFSLIEAAIDDVELYSGADVTASAASTAPASPDVSIGAPAVEIVPYGARGASHSFDLRLARAGRAEVRLFDVNGRLVRTLLAGNLPAGSHNLTWDGRTETGQKAAAGVYLLRATAANARAGTKVVLIR